MFYRDGSFTFVLRVGVNDLSAFVVDQIHESNPMTDVEKVQYVIPEWEPCESEPF